MSSSKLFFRILPSIVTIALTLIAFQQVYAADTYVVKQKKFDKHAWEEITKDMDFKEKEEQIQKQKTPNYHLSFPLLNGTVAKIIFFTIIISGLGFILFKLFAGNIILKNTKITTPEYSIADIEENIRETDLEAIL